MSLCACQERPQCEAYNGTCGGQSADWTALVPASWKLPLRLRAKFFCNECWQRFVTAWKTPMHGIDRPEGAGEDWKPSLLAHVMHYSKVEDQKLRQEGYIEPSYDPSIYYMRMTVEQLEERHAAREAWRMKQREEASAEDRKWMDEAEARAANNPEMGNRLMNLRMAYGKASQPAPRPKTSMGRNRDDRYTPAQMQNLLAWRKGLRELRASAAVSTPGESK